MRTVQKDISGWYTRVPLAALSLPPQPAANPEQATPVRSYREIMTGTKSEYHQDSRGQRVAATALNMKSWLTSESQLPLPASSGAPPQALREVVHLVSSPCHPPPSYRVQSQTQVLKTPLRLSLFYQLILWFKVTVGLRRRAATTCSHMLFSSIKHGAFLDAE